MKSPSSTTIKSVIYVKFYLIDYSILFRSVGMKFTNEGHIISLNIWSNIHVATVVGKQQNVHCNNQGSDLVQRILVKPWSSWKRFHVHSNYIKFTVTFHHIGRSIEQKDGTSANTRSLAVIKVKQSNITYMPLVIGLRYLYIRH